MNTMTTTTATAIRSAATVALVTAPLYILRRPIALATTLLVLGSFLTPFRHDVMEMYRDQSARKETSETRRLESQERLETLRLQNEATRARLETERAQAAAARLAAEAAAQAAAQQAAAQAAAAQQAAQQAAARKAEKQRLAAEKEAATRAAEQSLAAALYYVVADSVSEDVVRSVAQASRDGAGRLRIGPFTHSAFKDQGSALHRIRADLVDRGVSTIIVRQQLQQP
jgi:hypothetical protein